MPDPNRTCALSEFVYGSDMDWGSVADWVMATLTGAGFTAAVLQLRSNLNDSRLARKQAGRKEIESHEAMARAIGLKSAWRPGSNGVPPDHRGLIPVDIEVLNSSPYPIRNVVLQLSTDSDEHPMEIVYGIVLPGEHLRDSYEVQRSEVVFGELTGGATLKFSDTFGNHWSSSSSWRGLERVAHEPRIC